MRAARNRLTGSGTLARYAGSSVALQAVNAACSLVILSWLEPEAMGLWQTLLLIGTYVQLVQGGAIHGLGRELPFTMGQGDSATVLELAGTGRAVALVSVGLCLLGIPVAWVVSPTDVAGWGATAILVGTAAHLYRLYLGTTYRAAQAFEDLARVQAIETVVAILSMVLVYIWGFEGLAARFVTQMTAGAALNHLFRPIRQVGSFRWARLKDLFLVGIPIFAFGYLSDVAKSFPRLVLLSLGGVKWVGLFAPASAVVGALWMIPSALGTYIYPQMTHRFGRTGDRSSLWPIARSTALWSLGVGIPAAAFLALIVPVLVSRFAPAYAAAIPATQWVVGAGVFMGASVGVNALASLKAYRWMVVFVAIRLAVLFVLPWAGGKFAGGLTGVAVGMTAAYGLDFLAAMHITRRATQQGAEMS